MAPRTTALRVAVAALALAASASAQEKPGATLWIDDSSRTVRELKGIRLDEQHGGTTAAVLRYQQLLERPSTAGFLPVSAENPGDPTALYMGVREACRRSIARLDPDGLALYRATYDEKAHDAWQSALERRDLAALREVAFRYASTSWVDDALLSIAEIEAERGNFEDAAAALAPIVRSPGSFTIPLDRLRLVLLRWAQTNHALGRNDRVAALHRAATGGTALLAVMNGLLGLAGHPLDAALLRHRVLFETDLAFDGTRATLHEALDRMSMRRTAGPEPSFGIAPPPPAADREPSWGVAVPPVPMDPPMGNPRELLVVAGGGGGGDPMRAVLWDPSIEAGFSPPSGAAASGGRVYLHTGAEGVVLDARTGELAPWEWSTGDLLAPNDAVGKGRLPRRACVRGRRLFATIESGWSEYAEKDNPGQPATLRLLRCSLYAFDLDREGYRLWDTERPRGRAADVEFLSKASFVSPPTADGATVYAGAAFLKKDIELFVVALDAATGELKWKASLGWMESIGTQDRRPGTAQKVFPGLAPVVADGAVLYASNWGAIAALDAGNGEVRWLVKYGRKRPVAARGEQAEWAENAVEVREGRVVAAPLDSDWLLCLDLADGRLLGRPFDRVTDKMQFRYFRTLPNGRVAIVSDRKVWVAGVEEPRSRPTKVELEEPAIGRPFLAGDDLYVPGAKGVYRVRLSERRVEEALRWPERAVGGVELVAAGGGWVALTRDRVYGYR